MSENNKQNNNEKVEAPHEKKVKEASKRMKKTYGSSKKPSDVRKEILNKRGGGEAKRGKKPEYSKVPNSIITDPDLTSQECRLLIRLIYYAREKQYCWPSQRRLAADLEVSTRWVRNILSELNKKDKIRINEPNSEKYPKAPQNTQSKIYDLTPLKDYPY